MRWAACVRALIVVIAGTHSLGADLSHAAQLNQAPRVLAIMTVILLIGITVDSLVFGQLDRALRRRRGLLDPAA